VIRPGRPTDADGVRTLRTAYRAELAAAGQVPPPTTDWESWFARRVNAGDVRVVVEADRVVGYIAWQLRYASAGPVLVVRELYVAASERGQRHGGGLLARALDGLAQPTRLRSRLTPASTIRRRMRCCGRSAS
jgi:L-amino acid N-acyltransferase YncA